MLDLEIVTPPNTDGLDIVTLPEMRAHLRVTATTWDTDIQEAIRDVAAKLQAPLGDLNRTIFPTQWKLYLKAFPKSGIIRLPYPPLLTVDGISYENGQSPTGTFSATNYVVRRGSGTAPGEIEILSTSSWPTTAAHPRAVGITFTAGYDGTIFEYPRQLKRLIKLLAAHWLENREATITDIGRGILMSRKVEFGAEELRQSLRVPLALDDWNTDWEADLQ